MKICKVEGCNKEQAHLGWCDAHYLRNRRHGSPTGGAEPRDKRSITYKNERDIWKGIKQRCYNPNNPLYKKYGARGIKMSEDWKNDFLVFLKDMGERPSKSHSIDRIDNDGDYCKDNCRWATPFQQAQHTRQKGIYSRQKGVSYNKAIGYWYAFIHIDGVRHIKYAKTEEDAIMYRKELEKKCL